MRFLTVVSRAAPLAITSLAIGYYRDYLRQFADVFGTTCDFELEAPPSGVGEDAAKQGRKRPPTAAPDAAAPAAAADEGDVDREPTSAADAASLDIVDHEGRPRKRVALSGPDEGDDSSSGSSSGSGSGSGSGGGDDGAGVEAAGETAQPNKGCTIA